MKNMIRAFVVVLAVTGTVATANVSTQPQGNGTRLTLAKTSAFPIPSCPPDDPNACGFGGNGSGN